MRLVSKEQYEITAHNNSYVFLNDNDEHFYDIKRIKNTHWTKVLKYCSIIIKIYWSIDEKNSLYINIICYRVKCIK